MNYKELSKENGIGYSYWLENLKILFEDYQLQLPDSKSLGVHYHQGHSVWDVFITIRSQANAVSS